MLSGESGETVKPRRPPDGHVARGRGHPEPHPGAEEVFGGPLLRTTATTTSTSTPPSATTTATATASKLSAATTVRIRR